MIILNLYEIIGFILNVLLQIVFMEENMINDVFIEGRIAHDLEPRILKDDKMVLSFSIAVNKDKESKAEYFSVECWNDVALNVLDLAGKGSMILVKGRLKQEQYTKDETIRYVTRIIANYIKVLSSKKDTEY